MTYITEKHSLGDDELYTTFFKCPTCGNSLVFLGSNYCPHCGHRLCWDDYYKTQTEKMEAEKVKRKEISDKINEEFGCVEDGDSFWDRI